jgi:hypothetical protein
LIGPVNRLFNPSPPFTPASVALSLWEIQGSPLPGANCANQANFVDVGPALPFSENVSVSANLTEFARSALLWTLVMSMDPTGVARIQDFVKRLDFTRLSAPNSSTIAGEFRFGAAGYQIDFGQMMVSQPSVTWESAGKPSDDQLALVGSDVRKALDRIYTFASGESASRSDELG